LSEKVDQENSRLKYFPVSWFSSVIGMAGLSIAWNRAEHFFDPGFCLSSVMQSAPDFSFWLWSLGATMHLGITLYVFSSWMFQTQYEIAHLNPTWFIAVVGNVLVVLLIWRTIRAVLRHEICVAGH
jgi:tellurite resistance protein